MIIKGIKFDKAKRGRGTARVYKSPKSGHTYKVWMRGFKDWVLEIDGKPLMESFSNVYAPVRAIKEHENSNMVDFILQMIKKLSDENQEKIVKGLVWQI